MRVYDGAHFPSDVVGGAAAGIAAGTIVNAMAF
jgi:membrane-associated phospholipid phosphatase